MVFNSEIFFVFFFAVFALYLFLPHKPQNILLLIASYIFYGYWDWRFLSLLLFSTVLDYSCGRGIERAQKANLRKFLLILSMTGNLGLLASFKYFNFFSDSFYRFASAFGWKTSPVFLEIVLPLGISFYTFQTMSYTIDIYRRELKPIRSFLDFSLFVSFFPQLVAGPIERASRLLPQITNPRRLTWEGFSTGCFLFLWGLFMKVAVADNLAALVDPVFNSPGPYQGAFVLTASYAFAFQILCDFAGYSTMARGLAKCLGFELMDNFKQPYFTSNPRAFWSEWHISLSTWLRDYLYIPLGGNKKGNAKTYRNLMLTMLLGGLWHGAAWTFIVWGAYHGALLCLHRFVTSLQEKGRLRLPPLPEAVKTVLFFHVICVGWLFFRAQSLGQAGGMLYALASNMNFTEALGFEFQLGRILFLIAPVLLVQCLQRRSNDLLVPLRWPWPVRGVFYFGLLFLTVTLGVSGGKQFIYFQF